MALWKKSKTVEELNEMCAGTIHDFPWDQLYGTFG